MTRNRLALIALVIVVGAAALGVGIAYLFPTQYAARAQLVYLIGEEQPTGFLREDRNLSTQVQLMRSRSVLEPVGKAFGLSEKDLGRKLSVDLVAGTEVMNVELDDPSGGTAQAILTQLIDRYQKVTNDVAPASTRTYLQQQLDDVHRREADPNQSPAQRDALAERETTLLNRLDSVNLAGAQVKVVVPPYTDPDPVSPRPLFGLAAGALAGVLIAGCLILWRSRRWTKD